MKKRSLIILLFIVVSCIFFYKSIFFGQVPFPGDLLVNRNPYRTQSYLGYLPNSYPNKAQGIDVTNEIYPWKFFTIQEFKKGHIPFWNPHNFSGNAHMQNLQSAVFSPLNIFFFLFPFEDAWTLQIFFQPLLASIFMYIFLRHIKLNEWASFLGAIAFAFSSYMVVWMEYGNIDATWLWLPLLLYAASCFIQSQKLRYALLFITASFFMFLSGYIQAAFYLYLIIFSFELYILFTQNVKRTTYVFVMLIAMFFLPILLVLFQLIPTYELFIQSTRGAYSLQQIQGMLLKPYDWITFFVPDFFGNPATRNYWLTSTYIERVTYISIPFIFFAGYSLFYAKHVFKKLFAFLALAIVLITTNFPGIAYLYRLPIPVMNTTVPTRMLSVFIFCMIVLGAIGIHDWISNKKRYILIAVIFLAIYVTISFVTFIYGRVDPEMHTQLTVSLHNSILPTVLALFVVILVILYKKIKKPTLVALVIVTIIDLLYFFFKITPFSPKAFIYPQTPIMSYIKEHAGMYRFWGYGSAYVEANYQTLDGTYSPEGNDPLHVRAYGELLASSYTGQLPKILPRPDANVASGYGQDDLRKNPYRQKLLNLLGVKYVLHQNDISPDLSQPDTATFPPEIYRLDWNNKPWQIYENKQVLPRFFLASSYVIAHSKQDALDKFYSIDLSKTLIFFDKPSTLSRSGVSGFVTMQTYQPQKIVFDVKTANSTFLFLSDTYYPSWKVTVDGKLTKLYQADYAFRAVEVPAGNHKVIMYYDHIYFTEGLYIAIAAFGFIIVCLVYLRRNGKVF